MTLSDRLAVMRDGKIEQVGSPREIYHQPDNLFVADFIGDMNLIDGFAVETDSGTQVTLGDESGPVLPTHITLEPGELTIALRPEDIEVDYSSEPLFDATVTDRYFQGDHTEYSIQPSIDGLPELTVNEYRSEIDLQEGDTTSVGFRSDEVHIFDRQGTQASIDHTAQRLSSPEA